MESALTGGLQGNLGTTVLTCVVCPSTQTFLQMGGQTMELLVRLAPICGLHCAELTL